MEPLLKQLRELPGRAAAMPKAMRWALGAGGALLLAIVGTVTLLSGGAGYEYAFTNLTPEDASEAAATLKAANVVFRAEANGSALAVPSGKVHEARLLLAAAGLPRGGGVGFELFDRGDLGISDFTQRVNLRRATEGELSRTIGHLAAVRSARVHLTLPERSLYREEDRKSAAAVVLNLQPGRVMQERELAGIRHLVASAVSGLDPGAVTIVDGRGTVLSGDQSEGAKVGAREHELEAGLEQRIVDILEPAVGRGAVVARVTARMDSTEVESTADKYDPDSTSLRSTRKTTELIVQDGPGNAGVAGAAANQPLAPAGAGPAGGARVQTNREDDVRNFEVNKVTTHTMTRAPRLLGVSVAVLIEAVGGKPRTAAELKRLGDLAKRAVGFDEARGDNLEISSEPFTRGSEAAFKETPVWARPETLRAAGWSAAGLALLVLVVFVALRGRRSGSAGFGLLTPGARVGDLQAALAGGGARDGAALGEANATLRDRARELTQTDVSRASHLLRAWIASDSEHPGGGRG
jgi:flagellar M-ring protein FliF